MMIPDDYLKEDGDHIYIPHPVLSNSQKEIRNNVDILQCQQHPLVSTITLSINYTTVSIPNPPPPVNIAIPTTIPQSVSTTTTDPDPTTQQEGRWSSQSTATQALIMQSINATATPNPNRTQRGGRVVIPKHNHPGLRHAKSQRDGDSKSEQSTTGREGGHPKAQPPKPSPCKAPTRRRFQIRTEHNGEGG